MKRALFTAAAVAFSVLGCFYYCEIQNGVWLVVASGSLLLFSGALCAFGKCPKLCLAVTVPLFFFTCFYFGVLQECVLPVAALEGYEAEVTGRVLTAPQWYVDQFLCQVQTEYIGIEGAPQQARLLLRVYELEDVAVGDTLRATVTFYSVDKSFYAEGVYIGGYTQRIRELLSPDGFTLGAWAEGARRSVRDILYRYLSADGAGFATALLLGDKTYLPASIEEAYRACGLSHILAVSGLHLGLLCGMVLRLLRLCRCSRRVASTVCILFVVLFMLISGFTGSVSRAGLMYILALAARFVSRKSDPLNAVGGAIVLLLAVNPMLVGSYSLLLSYTSVSAILLFAPQLETLLHRATPSVAWVRWLWRKSVAPVALTVSALVGTLPAQVLCFGQVSLLTLPANLLVCAVAGGVLLALAAFLLLAALLPIEILWRPLFGIVEVFIGYCVKLPRWMGQAPFSTLDFDATFAFWCVGGCLVLVAAWMMVRPLGARAFFCGGLCLLLVCCSGFIMALVQRGVTQITVFASSAGSSTVVTHGGSAVVFGLTDATTPQVSHYLQSQGIRRVNALIFPTKDADKTQATLLAAQIPVEQILCADTEDVPQALPLAQVERIAPWPDAEICFYPTAYGAACRVQAGDKVCFLTHAGLDFSADAFSIGATDLIICSAALPKGLITKDSTAYFITQDTPSGILTAKRVHTEGFDCFRAVFGVKTVAKWHENGYSKYRLQK